jgi:hypothetical protein
MVALVIPQCPLALASGLMVVSSSPGQSGERALEGGSVVRLSFGLSSMDQFLCRWP